MNITDHDKLLNAEEALQLIDQMKYTEGRDVEEFDVLLDFLYEECQTDETVFFSLVDLAMCWDVLEKRFDKLRSLFHGKSHFVEYLYFFIEKNREYTDEEFINYDIIEQMKMWNKQYHSGAEHNVFE